MVQGSTTRERSPLQNHERLLGNEVAEKMLLFDTPTQLADPMATSQGQSCMDSSPTTVLISLMTRRLNEVSSVVPPNAYHIHLATLSCAH